MWNVYFQIMRLTYQLISFFLNYAAWTWPLCFTQLDFPERSLVKAALFLQLSRPFLPLHNPISCIYKR